MFYSGEYSRDLSPHLLMIAGGTGITPMYQIIKASVQDPQDKTQLRLIYANVNQDDIRTLSRLARGYRALQLISICYLNVVLRDELKGLERKAAGRLKVQVRRKCYQADVITRNLRVRFHSTSSTTLPRTGLEELDLSLVT